MKFTGLLFVALTLVGCNTFEELEDPFICDDYCDTALSECFDIDGPDLFLQDRGTCVEFCLTVYDNDPSEEGEVTGDTVQCRIQHLNLIGDDGGGSVFHCGHASPESGPCSEGGEF